MTSANNASSKVTGRVAFGSDARFFSGATVRVRLEDVSRADASARTLAEQVIRDVSYTPGGASDVPFVLHVERLSERRAYSVRVHVDLDGDGDIKRGDYVSTESYPVTGGHAHDLTVRVRRVE